jgi:uncharacterized protein
MNIDLGRVANELGLPVDKVERTVELLDAGNTVPFITRYRKEQTGALDEEQIRHIQDRVTRLRLLAERKQTILKSIESQGKLTPELSEQISKAESPKQLEDLYLPFRPKKQTLATIARQRGLEPLAKEIFEADPMALDLDTRIKDFISEDRDLKSPADVLLGVGHLLAERFSERADVRGVLRRIFYRSGKIVCSRIENTAEATGGAAGDSDDGSSSEVVETIGDVHDDVDATITTVTSEEMLEGAGELNLEAGGSVAVDPSFSLPESLEEDLADEAALATTIEGGSEFSITVGNDTIDLGAMESTELSTLEPTTELDFGATTSDTFSQPSLPAPSTARKEKEKEKKGDAVAARKAAKAQQKAALKELKRKKRERLEASFKDYFDHSESLVNCPPHRVLAINRGERAKILRVKIDADVEAMGREAEQILVRPEHPHGELLRNCVRDSLTRLLLPSLEREVRREMAEDAEEHAVRVFVSNLRKLLLQPPVRGKAVLAIDPGFRSGCKMAALDQFGNVLGHGVFHIIGKDDFRQKGRERFVELVTRNDIHVIAIGNGAGCREAEQLAADVIANELSGHDVAYVIVNEAGASVYSTSPTGREELPTLDPILRSAVSLGRRMIDPLSELVKIHPANLGVGLYQHDIKTKHLRDSLDAVVESCVNYVGVDANSASPSLLGYVSGLNQLIARRLYEFRRDHGPFKSREDFRKVPGLGEATFVQAAGFLKVFSGDNPLDATWIHPESYELTRRLLEKLGGAPSDLVDGLPKATAAPAKAPIAPREWILPDAPLASAASALAAPEHAEAEPVAVEPNLDAANDQAPAAESTTELEMVAVSEPSTATDTLAVSSHAAGESLAEETSPTTIETMEPSVSVAGVDLAAQHEAKERFHRITKALGSVDAPSMAKELGVSEILLRDLISALLRPGRDPREDLPPPIFRKGIVKLEDLSAGMELQGTVLNVVDFGAFVDIGLSDSGLVHISRLADRYIRNPHEVVSIGDVLRVWVVDVDGKRRRVSLTAIPPDAPRTQQGPRQQQRPPRQQHEQRPPRAPRPEGERGRDQGGQGQRGHDQRGQDQRGRQGGNRPQRGGDRRPPKQRPPQPAPTGKEFKSQLGTTSGPTYTVREIKQQKEVKPLTKAMEEGRKPMRSFSDLKQLFEKKTGKDEPETPVAANPPDSAPIAINEENGEATN